MPSDSSDTSVSILILILQLPSSALVAADFKQFGVFTPVGLFHSDSYRLGLQLIEPKFDQTRPVVLGGTEVHPLPVHASLDVDRLHTSLASTLNLVSPCGFPLIEGSPPFPRPCVPRGQDQLLVVMGESLEGDVRKIDTVRAFGSI